MGIFGRLRYRMCMYGWVYNKESQIFNLHTLEGERERDWLRDWRIIRSVFVSGSLYNIDLYVYICIIWICTISDDRYSWVLMVLFCSDVCIQRWWRWRSQFASLIWSQKKKMGVYRNDEAWRSHVYTDYYLYRKCSNWLLSSLPIIARDCQFKCVNYFCFSMKIFLGGRF